MHVGFWCKNQNERGHLEAVSMDGMMILKWICVDCVHLARDRNQWWAFMNTVIDHCHN